MHGIYGIDRLHSHIYLCRLYRPHALDPSLAQIIQDNFQAVMSLGHYYLFLPLSFSQNFQFCYWIIIVYKMPCLYVHTHNTHAHRHTNKHRHRHTQGAQSHESICGKLHGLHESFVTLCGHMSPVCVHTCMCTWIHACVNIDACTRTQPNAPICTNSMTVQFLFVEVW